MVKQFMGTGPGTLLDPSRGPALDVTRVTFNRLRFQHHVNSKSEY